MAPDQGCEFYLNNGRLDLSSLSEEIHENQGDDSQPLIKDSELTAIQRNDYDITVTLETLASIFQEDSLAEKQNTEPLNDDYQKKLDKAFNLKRLQEEMKEFGIDK